MSLPTAKNIFICYSHADEEVKKQLVAHLSALKRKGLISHWNDREILAGQEWDSEIKDKLNAADIIMPLISSDFIASEYCIDTELKIAMKRHLAGEAQLVPVIVRACDWYSMDFSSIQALPKDGVPIAKWADRDDAILNVIEGLKLLIKHMDKEAYVTNTDTISNKVEYNEDIVICLLPRGYIEIYNLGFRSANWDIYATYYHYNGQEIHSIHYATEYYKKAWVNEYKTRESQLKKLQIPNTDQALAHHIIYLIISIGSRGKNDNIQDIVNKHLQLEGNDIYFCEKGASFDRPSMVPKYARYVETSVLVDATHFLDNAIRVPNNGMSEHYVRSVIESEVREAYLFLEKKVGNHLFLDMLKQLIGKFNPDDEYEKIIAWSKRVKSLLEDATKLV